MTRASPSWYVSESPSESLRRAVEQSADRAEVVEVLSEREYEGLEHRRVEAIVAAGTNRVERAEADAASRQSSTDERPRPLPDRYADVADVAYLTDDEFARLLSVAFERFGGNTFRPEVRDCAVDLFWNRSHDTVGVRAVARPVGETVGQGVVAAVATGDATPTQGRNPSRIIVVTNASFAEQAVAVADESDVELYGGASLSYWLSKARIDQSLAGDVLEHGEEREYDLEARVAEAPTPPAPIRDVDPLEVSVDDQRDSVDAAAEPTRSESIPTTGDQPDPGELGRLYADPSEDGDFGAFDRFANRLDEDGDE